MASEIKVGDRVRVKETTRAPKCIGMAGRVAYFSAQIPRMAMVFLDDHPLLPIGFAVENLEPIPGPAPTAD